MNASAGVLALVALSACSPAPRETGINDPHEAANRRVHAFNTRFDAAVFGSGDAQVSDTGPHPLRNRLRDFASNTALPSTIVNDVLQGRIEDAAHNSVRLLFNTTIGLGGLFDVATDIGLEERGTDFGATLHAWGMPEGAYQELPILGPSTERDTLGMVVDLFTNPLSYTLPAPERYWPPVAPYVAMATDRLSYSATINDLLSESTDSYATMRLYYLDSRRYELNGGESGDDLYDIYEEAYE